MRVLYPNLIPEIEKTVQEKDISCIVCIASYDEYQFILMSGLTSDIEIHLVSLNSYISTLRFVEAYYEAISQLKDNSLLVIDDYRDFINGRVYDSRLYQESVNKIDSLGNRIVKLIKSSIRSDI